MYFPKPQGNVELIARAGYSDLGLEPKDKYKWITQGGVTRCMNIELNQPVAEVTCRTFAGPKPSGISGAFQRAGSFLLDAFKGGDVQTSRQMPTATHTGSSFLLPAAVLGVGVAAVLILKKKKSS